MLGIIFRYSEMDDGLVQNIAGFSGFFRAFTRPLIRQDISFYCIIKGK